MRGHVVTLCDLLPAEGITGASLILTSGACPVQGTSGLLYGCRPVSYQGGSAVLEITGIGGRVETTDASAMAAAQREALEEIGCEVEIIPQSETYVVRGAADVGRIALPDDSAPAALVFRRHRTPPHRPWHEVHQGDVCILVFRAHLLGDPRPTGELPALLWLSPTQVVATAERDVPLLQLLDGGATLVEREPGQTPRDALARLTDSQEALVLALGNDALAYYQRSCGC
jgi:8-oxo-dGTP pyrophosphatase MutT (NUDIX family)